MLKYYQKLLGPFPGNLLSMEKCDYHTPSTPVVQNVHEV